MQHTGKAEPWVSTGGSGCCRLFAVVTCCGCAVGEDCCLVEAALREPPAAVRRLCLEAAGSLHLLLLELGSQVAARAGDAVAAAAAHLLPVCRGQW